MWPPGLRLPTCIHLIRLTKCIFHNNLACEAAICDRLVVVFMFINRESFHGARDWGRSYPRKHHPQAEGSICGLRGQYVRPQPEDSRYAFIHLSFSNQVASLIGGRFQGNGGWRQASH